MQEEIEQLKKYVDMLESKQIYHRRKVEDLDVEITKTELAISRLRASQSTVTNFKTAKELMDEKTGAGF